MMALNSMIIKSEIECNNNPRNSVVATNATTKIIKCGVATEIMNGNKKQVIQSTPTTSTPAPPTNGGKMGSRRIFTPQFKLQVLDSYRTDSDCKGNQRATARKYGIHRRQIQKWLQVEQTLRTVVANNLANSSSATVVNGRGSINNTKLLTNHHHHHHHHQQQQQIGSNNNSSNVILKNNYINPTAELKISYDTTTRHRVAPNTNNNNHGPTHHHYSQHHQQMKNGGNTTTNTQPPTFYYAANTNDIILPYHHHHQHQHQQPSSHIGHQHHHSPIMQQPSHTTVLYHDVAPSSTTTSLTNTVGYETYEPNYPVVYPSYVYHSSPPPPLPAPQPVTATTEFVPIRLPFLNENAPIDLSLPLTERRALNRFHFEELRRPISPYNWQWRNIEDPAKPKLTDLSNAGCQAWDLSCRKRKHTVNDDNDDDGRGSTSGDSCDGRPTPAKTVKLFQPYLLSDDEEKERKSTPKSSDPIIWSHHQQNYIRSSLFVQDYNSYPSAFEPVVTAPATPSPPAFSPSTNKTTSYWVSQGSPVSGYDSSTSISSYTYSESAETLSNYSIDFKLQAIDAFYHDQHCQGSQKAVASKYNIDRQLIERWLQQEHDLRQRLVI